MPLQTRFLILITGSWAVAIIVLAIFQTYLSYSPVPIWDMWDGYLGFYLKAAEGDWSAWWIQHYEHRIILVRPLFWIDIHFFSGNFIFLLVINFIFFFLLALLFWKIVEDLMIHLNFRARRVIVGLFISAWLFLLCQGENLTWPFQVEFSLAFSLPLCALYYLQKCVESKKISLFIVACVCGVLSAGTLAIGVVTLPLMTCYALFMRQRPIRIAVLVILSSLILFLFYYHYRSGPILSEQVKDNIFSALIFNLILLGSPFYYIFNQVGHDLIITELSGFLFIIIFVYKSFQILFVKHPDPLKTALLFFILYICGAILGTTTGRFILGLDAALAPHHSTPAVIGWATLFALFAADIPTFTVAWRKWLVLLPVVALAILMLESQVKALAWHTDEVDFDRKVTILGLSLGVVDKEKLQTLTSPPDYGIIPPIAEKAYMRHLSVFGKYPFLGVREELGVTMPAPPLPACTGFLDDAQPSDDPRFMRINGWLIGPGHATKSEIARLLTLDGHEVGLALVGQSRPDVTRAIGVLNAGFRGYALSSAAGQRLIVRGENRDGLLCQMEVLMPGLPMSVQN